ncbi:MAG: hypothetical protein SNJ78_07780 [Spirochaetales bacterium]
MKKVKDRTLTTHPYNEETAQRIAIAIINFYHPEFLTLITLLQSLKEKAV